MATLRKSFLTETASNVTALHDLQADSFWQSDAVDNETDLALGVDIFVQIDTTTTAGNSSGYVNTFLSESNKATPEYSGGASGTNGSYAPNPSAEEQSKNLRYLGTISANAVETTARSYISVFTVYDPPADYSIILENRTDANLASSGNEVVIRPWKIESV